MQTIRADAGKKKIVRTIAGAVLAFTVFTHLGCALTPRLGQERSQAADSSVLATALVIAEKTSVAQMRAEEKNLTSKSDQLETLARLLARAGDFERALALVDQTEPEYVRDEAYAAIAERAIAAGDFGRADALVRRIADIDWWSIDPAFATVARAYRRVGQHGAAARLVRKISDPRERAMALLEEINDHPSGSPQIADTLSQAREAASTVSTYGIHFPQYEDRQQSLLAVMETAVRRGAYTEADKIIDAMDAVPDAAVAAIWTARALLARVQGYLIAGSREAAFNDLLRAKKLLTEQVPHAGRAGPFRDAVEILASISTRFSQLDHRDEAAETLRIASELAERLDVVREQEESWFSAGVLGFYVEAQARIAAAYARNEAMVDASAMAKRAMVTARRLPHSNLLSVEGTTTSEKPETWDAESSMEEDRIEALAWSAAAYEAAGDPEEAARIIDEAVDSIRTIPSEEWREYAWHALARAFLEIRGLERAVEVTARALLLDPDRYLAILDLVEPILASEHPERLLELFPALDDAFWKIDLCARLAQKSSAADAERLITTALAIIAQGNKGWDRGLLNLAVTAPGVENPVSSEQQELLRKILALETN